jgi:glycosyltransferase involved in cell wall biosynthesis
VTTRLIAAVNEASAQFSPDVVFIDSLQMGGLIRSINSLGALLVLGPHNVESELHLDIARSAEQSRLVRFYHGAEARKVARAERQLFPAYDLLCAISVHDAEAFAIRGARRVTIVPNGTWPVAARPSTGIRCQERLSLLFVGALTYRPNAEGVKWFAEAVLPRLRQVAEVELTVIGEGLPVTDAEGVSWVGHVDSVDPFFERCDAAVVPLLSGGGSRLKALEAFGRRVPVVATRKGVAGIEVEDGRHVWLGEDEDSLTRACLDLYEGLLRRPDEVGRRVEQAFAVARRLTWDEIAKDFLDDLQKLRPPI